MHASAMKATPVARPSMPSTTLKALVMSTIQTSVAGRLRKPSIWWSPTKTVASVSIRIPSW